MPQRQNLGTEVHESPFERCKVPNEAPTFNAWVNRSIPNQACDKSDPKIPPAKNGSKGKSKKNESCRRGKGAGVEGESSGARAGTSTHLLALADTGYQQAGPDGGPTNEKPGWSGTGERAAFHRHILPEVLGEILGCLGNPTMSYGGSYARHTSYCYADIDIRVMTDRPVTPAHRERIFDKLQVKRDQSKDSRSFFGNAEFSFEQFAIKVSIPKMTGKKTTGLDEYVVIFQNREDWSSEALMYPTLRGSTDRFEADRYLLEFYHGNTGAQNVARLIKYATYNIEGKLPGAIIECVTKRVAYRLFHAGNNLQAIAEFDNPTDYGAEYIPLHEGDVVELEHVDGSWSYGKVGVQRGWFPTAYISDAGVSGDGIKDWCDKHQHELYRSVVYEIGLGTDSTIMTTMIDDVADEEEHVKTQTAKMIHGMSEFYREEENCEYVYIKRSPARTWAQWDFLGHSATCAPHPQYSTGMPGRAETGSAASSSTQSTKGQGKGFKGKFVRDASVGIETVTEFMSIPRSATEFAGFVDKGIPGN